MPTIIILFVSLLEVRQNFVSEVVMAFIIYLPTLPYNILFTERRGQFKSVVAELVNTVSTNKFFKTLLNYTVSDMAHVFGRAFGNSSLFIHYLCFSFVSYSAVFYDCLALGLSRFKQIFCMTMTRMFKKYYS